MENAQALAQQFVLSEFREDHAYFIHIEKSMLDLLKFYNSVLAFVVPVGTGLAALLDSGFSVTFFGAVAALTGVFSLLGLYILGMYVELRIRKIKTLEQLAIIRQKMMAMDPGLDGTLKMITSIAKCPPYLRRPSSEWYTVIYVAFMNSLALGCSVACVAASAGGAVGLCSVAQAFWLLAIIAPVLAACWVLQFLWATKYCYRFDLRREQDYSVQNDYSFLEPFPYFPLVFKPFDLLARWYERRIRQGLMSG